MISERLPDDPSALIPFAFVGLFALLAYDEATARRAAFVGLAVIFGAMTIDYLRDDEIADLLEETPTIEARTVEGEIRQLIPPEEQSDYALSEGIAQRLDDETIAVVGETADPSGLEAALWWLSLGTIGGVDLRDRPVVLLDPDLAAIVNEGDEVELAVRQVVAPLEGTYVATDDTPVVDDEVADVDRAPQREEVRKRRHARDQLALTFDVEESDETALVAVDGDRA